MGGGSGIITREELVAPAKRFGVKYHAQRRSAGTDNFPT